MKKERPILFSTPMVKAILEGRKTQTRRVVKPQPTGDFHSREPKILFYKESESYRFIDNAGRTTAFVKSPYGKPGDVLWVRETCLWVMRDHAHDLLEGNRDGIQWAYKASQGNDWFDYAKEKYGYKWKPSIHMPKDAARIWLRITNVRVERLQDISDDDAAAEGIKAIGKDTNVEAFRTLWYSINGAESWKANPWVWVVEFERIEKP